MVNYSETRLDATFAALSHPIRRAIVDRLKHGDVATKVLAEPFAVSLPAILKHLDVLERAGLLSRYKRGRVNYCRLAAAPLEDAAAWLAAYQQFWEVRLDELEHHLQALASGEEPTDETSNENHTQT